MTRPAARHLQFLVTLAVVAMPCGRAGAQPAAPPPPVVAPASPADLPLTDTIDPASPLAPMPDLGVDWPDLEAPDAAIPADAAAAPDDAARERRYRVVLAGIDGVEPGVRTLFHQVSVLKQGEGKPANSAQLQRRAEEDERALHDILQATGRYDATVSTALATAADGSATVTLTAEPGEPYDFTSVSLPGIDATGAQAEALTAAFAVKPGDPVDAARVNAGIAALKVALGREGYPFGKVGEPDVTVDREAHAATLSLPVEAGARARFGRIKLRGREVFPADHVARIARFRPGDEYDAALVEDLRRALVTTTLVSSVEIVPTPSETPGQVDLTVTLARAPVRTIAGELGYSTGEGVRSEVSWQHRNLIKPEGAVTFRGVLGTREQLLGAVLRRGNFGARDRVLNALVSASNSKLNAYEAKTFTIAGSIERQTNIIWQKKWTWSYGAELLASDERDSDLAGNSRRRTFAIAALPTSLAYDGSDDLLNPMRGYRLSGRLSPEASLQNGTFTYLKGQVDGSAYVPVTGFTSIAGRVRLGSIFGASRDRIAPSRRFYAGGGGSVRGFSYQAIGPEDAFGDPVGGRSLAEFSLEARVRFGDFGVVPFLDAGNLYTTTYPKFTGLRYGAGLGVRYYSSFGPIRVDVGTPLGRRPGESRVAVYVSLGQAF
ncbi:autotransporter assembly complex protein TamA [Sphingomonas naphthae]|uniref:Autotransporter assembly complex protein TamA n=1 Tax=Sphingomonas naphthae TaxID=1813468 RepID=A0ABY7TMB8_9SPHN|nr:autotransporter assembly complex family protein [Sphingomonas naphthae]WCT74100.1 autotransporter assembly complex protein TamA [Sphingomonas naphthae]